MRLFKYLLQTFPNLRGRLWPRAVERLVPASRSSLSKRSWQVIPTRCWSRPRGWRCSGPTPSRPSSSLHPGGTGTCSTVDHCFQWKVNQSVFSLSHNTYPLFNGMLFCLFRQKFNFMFPRDNLSIAGEAINQADIVPKENTFLYYCCSLDNVQGGRFSVGRIL